MHLSGSTNYTNYGQIAGTREHGSLIFYVRAAANLLSALSPVYC